MKKYLLLISAMAFAIMSTAQNIPNRNFENWSVDTLYENTIEWLTPLDEFYSPEIATVLKSTDAQDGDYSILLSNDTINGDTTFGYALQGTLGVDGPESGIAYTSDIDSITGWYKSEMVGTDTAVILIIQYSNSDTVLQAFGIGGVQNNWSKFAFALDTVAGALEEVFVGFISADPEIGGFTGDFNPNSWIMFDNISFVNDGVAPDPIPDFSFEDWDALSYEDPLEWSTFNLYSSIVGDDVQVEKTTDAYSGNYAMKITSQYSDAVNDTIGVVSNSQIGDILPGGFAFDEVPLNISGYYKYNPATNWDTAAVAVFLSKWNSAADTTEEVDIQFFQLLPQNNYTNFSFDLDTAGLDTSMFDSVNIVFVSSQYAFDGGAPLGSELFLDDVWLDSKCAYADTTELWAFDSVIEYYGENGFFEFDGESSQYLIEDIYLDYTWSNGDTTSYLNINDYSNVADEIYLLSVKDSNSCEINDGIFIEFMLLEDISEIDNRNILIYPNPASSIINVDLSKFDQSLEKEITIYDLLGNQILSTFVLTGNKQLDISSLPKGAYLMNVRIGEELMTYKVIKK